MRRAACAAAAAALVLAPLLGPFGCGGSGPRVLRLSHITSPGSSWDKGARRFADLVRERSQGRILVRVFPAGQAANHNQRAELSMLGSGSLDMALVSTIILALYLDPRFDLVGLPWLFPDHAAAERVLDGPVGRELLALLETKGIVGLAYGANGFRQITNSVRPVRAPADLAGLRCRVAGSAMYARTLELLGADPLTMNFGEVYTSLQQGVIQAQENPLSIIASSRLYEVQRYCTIWNYSYDPIILAVNRRTLESLAPADRDLLRACAREAMQYQRQVVHEEDRTLPEVLRSKGMQVERLDPDRIRAFRAAVAPVYREFSDVVGRERLERLLKELGSGPEIPLQSQRTVVYSRNVSAKY